MSTATLENHGARFTYKPGEISWVTAGKTAAAVITKVGKEGYIHGYICVRPPCGPVYAGAVHDKSTGKIFHDGSLVARQLKKEDGDTGYSIDHIESDGSKTKLTGFTTRGQAAIAAVAYHDIGILHGQQADGAAKNSLTDAGSRLAAGDTAGAAQLLRDAATAARASGNEGAASHADHIRAGLTGEDAVEPKPIMPAAFPAVTEAASPLLSPKTPDEVASKLENDPSYVPSDSEHAALKAEYDKKTAEWQANDNYNAARFAAQAHVQNLYKAVEESKKRRQLAAETAAAQAAHGKKLDVSMMAGKMTDYLSPSDAAEWKSMIADSHLKFPDPADAPWVDGRSPGSARAERLDRLKYTAAQQMLEKAGVPHEAAEAIAGWPSMKTGDRYGSMNGDDRFNSMESMISDWATTGENAGKVSAAYNRARAMNSPPDTRAADFTRHREKITVTPAYSFDGWKWDDESPEAAKRRDDAAVYWGIRAQQHYTSQVIGSLPKRAQQDEIPVARMIYGDQAKALRNAVENGQDWKAATRSLSSWAEPSPRAAKSVERYITGDMWHSGVMGQNPVWLAQKVPPSQVFMHWRGEGELRNGVKVLGEIVPADSDVTSANAGMNDNLATALATAPSSSSTAAGKAVR